MSVKMSKVGIFQFFKYLSRAGGGAVTSAVDWKYHRPVTGASTRPRRYKRIIFNYLDDSYGAENNVRHRALSSCLNY
jgi:hypothetical protein